MERCSVVVAVVVCFLTGPAHPATSNGQTLAAMIHNPVQHDGADDYCDALCEMLKSQLCTPEDTNPDCLLAETHVYPPSKFRSHRAVTVLTPKGCDVHSTEQRCEKRTKTFTELPL